MHPNSLYSRFLQLLFVSTRYERRTYALPNLGLSAGERTVWMSLRRQSVAIFSVNDHCT